MEHWRKELYHHGILGMKWGKRNGPPYPLGMSDHSASERKAGWKKSLHKVEKQSGKAYNKSASESSTSEKQKRRLSDKQKRAIKIGAAAVATGLAAYGTYRLVKSGKLNKLVNLGKNKAEPFLVGQAPEAPKVFAKKLSEPESILDTLTKANPLRGNKEGVNNCVPCSIAGVLRQAGYDVTAKSTGGVMQHPGGVVEECFKGAKVLDGSAITFGKSREDASRFLVKKFGNNAEGVCSIKWKGTSDGHCFSWKIIDRKVLFYDGQTGAKGVQLKKYWDLIDENGPLFAARLDNAKINWEAISKYINT